MTTRSLVPVSALTSVLVLGLGLAASVVARPCVPLADGDDGGCAPPDRDAYRCEAKVAKEAAKLEQRMSACHVTKAERPIVFDEEGCEALARGRFDAALQKLADAGCPACLAANAGALRDDTEQLVDDRNGDAFCAGSTPFGGEDSGFVPPDNLALACGRRLTKAAAKVAKLVTLCHQRAALADLKQSTFDEEACETTGRARVDASLAEFFADHPHCPGCGPQNQASLLDGYGQFFDGEVASRA